jgi:perosamine synthetase
MLSDLIKLIRLIYGEGLIKLHRYIPKDPDQLNVFKSIGHADCYGKEVDKFEAMLSEYTGAKHVIATCSGTAALYAALWMFNDRQYAYMPNYTFRATKSAATENNLECSYADIEERTLGIDSFWNVASKCINVPVWVFGMPFTMRRGTSILMIEDAAEALGTFVDGKHAGTFGEAGILSFNGNKILTTGGGGAVLTDDAELAQNIREFITRGFNLSMPALNAALGLSQMERIEETIAKKREIAHTYHDFFDGSEIRFVTEPGNCRSNYWLSTLVFPTNPMRDYWYDTLEAAGIETRKGFELLDPNADTPVAKDLVGRILNLPSGVPK